MPEQGGTPFPKRNRLAVASLLLPILGVALFALSNIWGHWTPLGQAVILAGFATGVLAVVLAITAFIQIRGGRGRPADHRMGVYGMLLAILVIPPAGLFLPEYGCCRTVAHWAECHKHMQALCLAMMEYVEDHNGYFPPPSHWNDAIRLYVKSAKAWTCPDVRGDVPTYAMNIRLKGLNMSDLPAPADAVMLFESIPGRNLSGGPELMPSPWRHRQAEMVGFADGHAKMQHNVQWRLNWDPKRVAP